MIEYKVFRIELKDKLMRKVPTQDYHQIIIEQGRLGYKLVHMFAPALYAQGLADYIELVFEREY
jgi:hypothetical protein